MAFFLDQQARGSSVGVLALADLPRWGWLTRLESPLVHDLGIALLVLSGLVAAWLLWFGRSARRRRAFRRGRKLLAQGEWQGALVQVQAARGRANLSVQWQGRLRNLEGECYRLAAEQALQARQFTVSLTCLVQATHLLGLSEADAREHVLGAMLAETRRLFAASTGPGTGPVQELLQQLLQIEPCRSEAHFWLGLCHTREKRPVPALASLHQAQHADGKRSFDASLYLGMLLLRQGQPQEGLRHLADANRLHAACPVLAWQLGECLLATQGDPAMAARVLQRALGPQGLPQWIKHPQRLWVEGFPASALSFVARLAADNRYICPLLGSDVADMVRQAQMALAQAQYRLGQFAEAVATYQRVLQEAPPTAPVLRGLGLCLARLERYDEAYRHLRTVHEQDQPKQPMTAAYLALCAARGKPSRPEDRIGNLRWAIQLLGRHPAASDPEWTQLASLVFAEARGQGLVPSAAEQRGLIEALGAVEAADPLAAAAYDQALATAPDTVQPNHAWLYGQAAAAHGVRGPRDLDWFQRIFQDPAPARQFFAARGWDFSAVEFAFLKRWAEQHPGRFPEVLGPEYPVQGQKGLLERARMAEEAGQADQALACAEVLCKLAPDHAAAHDSLARLYYRRGDAEAAVRVLDAWQAVLPADPRPLVRKAVIEHQRQNQTAAIDALQQGLLRTRGRARARVAFLGARISLASDQRGAAARFLEECLAEDPGHSMALACLTAVRCLEGDSAGMAALAERLDQLPDANDRLQFLAAAAHLVNGDNLRAIEAASAVQDGTVLTAECHYLMGLANLKHDDLRQAVQELQKTAAAPESPSAEHARLILGRIRFNEGAYDETEHWWEGINQAASWRWQMNIVLPGVALLAGLAAYRAGRFEPAAEKFRTAELLGYADPRLRSFQSLALFKAGQRLLLADEGHGCGPLQAEVAASLLQQAIETGGPLPQAQYLLGLALRRLGKVREARQVFRQVTPDAAPVHGQLGLLALQENQLALAEQEFAQAWQQPPTRFAAGRNLLMTRLALGRFAACAELLPALADLAISPDQQRFLGRVRTLLGWLGTVPDAPAGPQSAEEEQALLRFLRRLGQVEPVAAILKAWRSAGAAGAAVHDAQVEAILLQARQLLLRCEWTAAERLLTPLVQEKGMAVQTRAALLNLLGCCVCLGQEFEAGARYLRAAGQLVPDDAHVQQNLALALEWQDDLLQADPCWNRYLDLINVAPAHPDAPADYVAQLRYEAFLHLANLYTRKQVTASALVYLERAHALRKDNPELLERLYQFYSQLRRTADAQGVLLRLRQLRPNDPQYELFAIDLVEVRTVADIERKVEALEQVAARFAQDSRARERMAAVIDGILPLIGRLCDQLSDQLDQVLNQVQNLPNYQINWGTVRELMRNLRQEYQRLRRLVGRCQALETGGEHAQVLRELGHLLDNKIAFCRRWEGE